MEKKAIIDIGSGSIRLVIYEKRSNGLYKEWVNLKVVARLRQYLGSDQILSDSGVERCLTILQDFRDILLFHGVDQKSVRCVATATIRQASNQKSICKLVKEKVGFDIDVLSETEEAHFGYLAISYSTTYEHAVTIDIGGGSTEITYYRNRALEQFHSFPFGVLSLKERFLVNEEEGRYNQKEMELLLRKSFESLDWLDNLQVPIIAIGGSARNVAQIQQHQINYPLAGIHQYEMSINELKLLAQKVEKMSAFELEKLEGLSKDRVDIIVPALEVFVELSQVTNASRFVFSKKGLRDGLLMSQIGLSKKAHSIREDHIQGMLKQYGVSISHANHVAFLAKILYQKLAQRFALQSQSKSERIIVESAKLYLIGQSIDLDVASHHTFNLIANQSMDAMSHKERLVIALIASFKNRSLLKQYVSPFESWFSKEELEDIRIAGAMVKLSSVLDSTKRGLVKMLDVEYSSGQEEIHIQIDLTGDGLIERSHAIKEVRHLEKALKCKIRLFFNVQ